VSFRREQEASPEIREGCGSWWEVPEGKAEATTALLYLHGFTGSPGDLGDALHRIRGDERVAIGAKRLTGHGLRAPDALVGVSRQQWEADGESALEYASRLGRHVWILGTSMGATLGLLMAARFPEVVSGVVAWSPAVVPRDRSVLDQMAGLAPQVVVDRRERSAEHALYWSKDVHTDGYRALRSAMAAWCPEVLAKGLSCPALFGIGERDEVADLRAMEAFAASIPSEVSLQVKRFAEGAHALASPFRSAAADDVIDEARRFVFGKAERQ
jgi:pimeloyl-ACP methyl ester carboxylesterase